MSVEISEHTEATTSAQARPRWRLPHTAAFALQVSMLLVFLAASMAPTPLYATYQAQWGFTPTVTTEIFAVYALAVLATLLTVGGLSDHVGRRPVLIAAVVAQVAALVVFLTATGVASLMIARVLQGVAAGAALGALGAGLLDLDKVKGTVANGVGAMAGTAIGALIAGVFVQLLPAPTHLVYVLLLAIIIAQGVGVLLMRETASPRPGALASLWPRLGVPGRARAAFLIGVPVFVATWSLTGLYGALGPALTRQVAGSSSAILGGLSLFILAGAGSVTVLVTRNGDARRLQVWGAFALIAGVGITQVALVASSVFVLFLGTAIAGVGFGTAFQGALRTVLPLAEVHERAGLLSTIFVVCYLSMGIPAVIAGVLVTRGDLVTTAHEYGFVVMALATVPLIAMLARGSSARRRVTA